MWFRGRRVGVQKRITACRGHVGDMNASPLHRLPNVVDTAIYPHLKSVRLPAAVGLFQPSRPPSCGMNMVRGDFLPVHDEILASPRSAAGNHAGLIRWQSDPAAECAGLCSWTCCLFYLLPALLMAW